MKHSDIIKLTARSSRCSVALTKRIIDSYYESLELAWDLEEPILIKGVGRFETRHRAGHLRRFKDDIITIPPCRTVKFKISPAMKKRLNDENRQR